MSIQEREKDETMNQGKRGEDSDPKELRRTVRSG
jgi:hypothetical protein